MQYFAIMPKQHPYHGSFIRILAPTIHTARWSIRKYFGVWPVLQREYPTGLTEITMRGERV